MTEILETEQ